MNDMFAQDHDLCNNSYTLFPPFPANTQPENIGEVHVLGKSEKTGMVFIICLAEVAYKLKQLGFNITKNEEP